MGCKRKADNDTPTNTLHINWQHPLLWPQILQAAVKVGHSMSPIEIAKELKLHDPRLFERIMPQVIGAWIDHGGTCPIWSKSVLE